MERKTRKLIKSEIEAYIKKNGGTYSAWYVGVSEDSTRRLFDEHDVDKENDLWIRKQAYDADKAREVEQHFLDKGCEGGPGGGDDGADHIYAYKITASTDP